MNGNLRNQNLKASTVKIYYVTDNSDLTINFSTRGGGTVIKGFSSIIIPVVDKGNLNKILTYKVLLSKVTLIMLLDFN